MQRWWAWTALLVLASCGGSGGPGAASDTTPVVVGFQHGLATGAVSATPPNNLAQVAVSALSASGQPLAGPAVASPANGWTVTLHVPNGNGIVIYAKGLDAAGKLIYLGRSGPLTLVGVPRNVQLTMYPVVAIQAPPQVRVGAVVDLYATVGGVPPQTLQVQWSSSCGTPTPIANGHVRWRAPFAPTGCLFTAWAVGQPIGVGYASIQVQPVGLTAQGAVPSTPTLGSGPVVSVRVVNLNGDAYPDVVVTHGPGNFSPTWDLASLPGTGFGSLLGQAVAQVSSQSPYQDFWTYDVTGDGLEDVLLIGTGTVDIYANNGTGSYKPSSVVSGLVAQPLFVSIDGDLNGDTIPDLVDTYSAGVEVVWGAVAGGGYAYTGPGVTVPVSPYTQPGHFRAQDLNGDGLLDLVGDALANPLSGLVATVVLKNLGGGNFAAPVGYATDAVTYPVFGDLNRDGYADIVVGTNAPGFAVLVNDTKGGFSLLSRTGSPVSGVAVADFNADGYLDVAVAEDYGPGAGGGVSLWLNRLGTNAGVLLPFMPDASVLLGYQVGSIAVGDFNRDGFPDLVVGSRSSAQVEVLLNTLGGGGAAPPLGVGAVP